jgi:hypothetical protein
VDSNVFDGELCDLDGPKAVGIVPIQHGRSAKLLPRQALPILAQAYAKLFELLVDITLLGECQDRVTVLNRARPRRRQRIVDFESGRPRLLTNKAWVPLQVLQPVTDILDLLQRPSGSGDVAQGAQHEPARGMPPDVVSASYRCPVPRKVEMTGPGRLGGPTGWRGSAAKAW